MHESTVVCNDYKIVVFIKMPSTVKKTFLSVCLGWCLFYIVIYYTLRNINTGMSKFLLNRVCILHLCGL